MSGRAGLSLGRDVESWKGDNLQPGHEPARSSGRLPAVLLRSMQRRSAAGASAEMTAAAAQQPAQLRAQQLRTIFVARCSYSCAPMLPLELYAPPVCSVTAYLPDKTQLFDG